MALVIEGVSEMIKFDNIQIKYGDFVAIDNLNLDIHEGEFFTFLGPSGCGKSTTLRALVGFLDPSSEVLKLMEQMSLIWNLKSVELVLYFNLMRYFQL